MIEEQLDTQILSAAQPGWRKVAFVVAQVARNLGTESDDEYAAIADRVGRLVAQGRLIARGDLSDWRGSEVRLVGVVQNG